MISIAIVWAVVILIANLLAYLSYSYGTLKGYEQGLDEAEQIIREVRGQND